MAAAPLRTIIILALGAAVLGGPDALRALLEFTGQSPCLDIAICVFVMFVVTTYHLGALLLVRFVRDARPGDAAAAARGGAQGHGAAVTDCIAQVSLLVSVCVGFLVAACLVSLPPPPPSVPSGGLGTATSFVAVTVIAAAAAAVRCAWERFSRTRQTVCFLFVALLLAAAISSAALGGGLNLEARRLFPGFPFRSAITNNVPVGVAVAAAVAGTALVVRFSRMARNAAGAAATTTGQLPGARGAGASAS